LAVRAVPRSGGSAELLECFGISAKGIAEAARRQLRLKPLNSRAST